MGNLMMYSILYSNVYNTNFHNKVQNKDSFRSKEIVLLILKKVAMIHTYYYALYAWINLFKFPHESSLT